MSSAPRPEHCQLPYEVRVDWGLAGLRMLTAECAAVVIVDVLSFSTSVDVALGRGATVLPQVWADRGTPVDGAVPAGARDGDGPSLRPSSLLALDAGTRLALPSPNGATLCATAAGIAGESGGTVVFVGCLRNASAVARAARAIGGPVGIVAAGEHWPDGTLRFALEDLVGAGAIASALPAAERSPEAQAAADQFTSARDRGLAAVLGACASGEELAADGYRADITLAAAHDVSRTVPRFTDGELAAWVPPGLRVGADLPNDGWWTGPNLPGR